MNEETTRIINTIKLLGIDMIDVAQSGHPGITLDAAPMLYTLYTNHLNINPNDPNWFNRDRFILSAGHASALLYAQLFMCGYDLSLDDLVRFRSLNSKTPGHPEKNITPGVDYTTGPLGEGFAAAVGMAMSEKYLSSLISKEVDNQKLINHYTYCLVSDGDLEEGVSYEAASLAGLYGLGKLIVLYDSNDITLDSPKNKASRENIQKRFEAIGWDVDYVSDGTNIKDIDNAIRRAKRITNRPSIIEIKTIIGQDSFNQGTNLVHGRPLSKDDIVNLRRQYHIELGKFELEASMVNNYRKAFKNRTNTVYKAWQEYYQEFKKSNNNLVQKFVNLIENGNCSLDFSASSFKIHPSYEEELRESNSKIMNLISDRTPFFLGGSADLGGSCKTNLYKEADFSKTTPTGKNIYYGVREHAMGAITNALACDHLMPFASTFLIFADFLKPSLRLACLMNIPVTYIFTHDSIAVGEDGATHEPIEQLTTLRSIPNNTVIRPADINEVIGAWDNINTRKTPTSLIISRSDAHILSGTDGTKVGLGGYIIKKEKNKIDAILISCGRDLTNALIAAVDLPNYDFRVVSMPSQELFLKQPAAYRDSILPPHTKIIAIEAGSPYTWTRFTTLDHVIGLTEFGASGKSKDVLKQYKFDKESIKERVIAILEK